MEELNTFYQNYPLLFVGRNPRNQCLVNTPHNMNMTRDLILRRNWEDEYGETEFGIKCTEQLYLCATGNYEQPTVFSENPSDDIQELIFSHQVSERSYGFVKEILPSRRRDFIQLATEDVENASVHQLMKFCYAHGMHITYDAEIEELRRMSKWILRNESDDVSFDHMSVLMQQAIDLSVLAQCTEKFSQKSSMSERLDQLSSAGIEATKEMIGIEAEAQQDAAELQLAAQDANERRTMDEFQMRVLRSIYEAKVASEMREQNESFDNFDPDFDQNAMNSPMSTGNEEIAD